MSTARIAALLFAFQWQLSVALQCRSGWIHHEDVCYHFSHDKETWTGAEAMCRILGGTLAEIQSANENNFIANQVKYAKGRLWLGGTDVQVEGEWRWMGTNEILTYTSWFPGQPSNSGDLENCLEYMNGTHQWNDRLCTSQLLYICEERQETSEIVGK